jgi:hypothetical protein
VIKEDVVGRTLAVLPRRFREASVAVQAAFRVFGEPVVGVVARAETVVDPARRRLFDLFLLRFFPGGRLLG